MGGGESRDREAGMTVGGQPTNDNPAAAARLGDSHGREAWMAAVQDGDPTPRGRGDPIDRRGESDGQLGQRRAADVDTETAPTKPKEIKS